jgi:hypothetical protein
MINIHRIDKRGLLQLKFIHVGISMLCIGDGVHRRGIAHRMDMVLRA